MSVSDYSLAPSSNTAISGINIGEGCPPGNINDAIRQLMADVKEMRDQVATGHADFRVMIPLGGAVRWYGDTIPTGFMPADGRALSRTTYATLFALWGTRFGTGDGTTTFNIPDERGRAAIGAGQGTGLTNRALGWSGGSETHQLTVEQLPVHSHPLNLSTQAAGAHTHRYRQGGSYTNVPNSGSVTRGYVDGGGPTVGMWDTEAVGHHVHAITGDTDNRGAGQAHSNMQPSFAAHWIIRVQ